MTLSSSCAHRRLEVSYRLVGLVSQLLFVDGRWPFSVLSVVGRYILIFHATLHPGENMATPYYSAGAGANGPAVYDHRHPTHGVGALESELPPHQDGGDGGGTWTKGEVQPRRCNDVLFALLFVGHLVGMAVTAGIYAPLAFQSVVEQAENAAGGEMAEDEDGGQRDLLADGEEGAGSRSGLASWIARTVARVVVSSTAGRRLEEDWGDVSGVNDFDDLLLLLSIR